MSAAAVAAVTALPMIISWSTAASAWATSRAPRWRRCAAAAGKATWLRPLDAGGACQWAWTARPAQQDGQEGAEEAMLWCCRSVTGAGCARACELPVMLLTGFDGSLGLLWSGGINALARPAAAFLSQETDGTVLVCVDLALPRVDVRMNCHNSSSET